MARKRWRVKMQEELNPLPKALNPRPSLLRLLTLPVRVAVLAIVGLGALLASASPETRLVLLVRVTYICGLFVPALVLSTVVGWLTFSGKIFKRVLLGTCLFTAAISSWPLAIYLAQEGDDPPS